MPGVYCFTPAGGNFLTLEASAIIPLTLRQGAWVTTAEHRQATITYRDGPPITNRSETVATAVPTGRSATGKMCSGAQSSDYNAKGVFISAPPQLGRLDR